MLDLDAGVHLEEIEAPRLHVEHELDGAGAAVAFLLAKRHRRFAHCGAGRGGQPGGGAFLDDLLEAALDRAVAFVNVHRVPVAEAEHLHLDVPRLGDVAL